MTKRILWGLAFVFLISIFFSITPAGGLILIKFDYLIPIIAAIVFVWQIARKTLNVYSGIGLVFMLAIYLAAFLKLSNSFGTGSLASETLVMQIISLFAVALPFILIAGAFIFGIIGIAASENHSPKQTAAIIDFIIIVLFLFSLAVSFAGAQRY